jgi:hypothetical protein
MEWALYCDCSDSNQPASAKDNAMFRRNFVFGATSSIPLIAPAAASSSDVELHYRGVQFRCSREAKDDLLAIHGIDIVPTVKRGIDQMLAMHNRTSGDFRVCVSVNNDYALDCCTTTVQVRRFEDSNP